MYWFQWETLHNFFLSMGYWWYILSSLIQVEAYASVIFIFCSLRVMNFIIIMIIYFILKVILFHRLQLLYHHYYESNKNFLILLFEDFTWKSIEYSHLILELLLSIIQTMQNFLHKLWNCWTWSLAHLLWNISFRISCLTTCPATGTRCSLLWFNWHARYGHFSMFSKWKIISQMARSEEIDNLHFIELV